MKQGRSLSELAQELEAQQERKLDFVTDTRKVEMELLPEGLPILHVDGVASLDVGKHAARQMGTRVGVPAKFYDLMADGTPRERNALAEVFNSRFNDHPENRLIRAFKTDEFGNGFARAFLSDRYRRLDNVELLMNALPVLQEAGNGMRIVSCEVTERRLYLKAFFDDIVAEPVVGDIVRSGLVISNSEIGDGSLRVQRMAERLVCLNGQTLGKPMRKFHVGRTNDEGLLNVLSDEAFEADDKALWLKVRDVIKASLDRDAFDEAVDMMREATTRRLDDSPAAVEVLAQKFNLADYEQRGVLSALIEGDEILNANGLRQTQYGLMQAVTAFSQTVDSYERATELEEVGGQILELAPSEWRSIARAA